MSSDSRLQRDHLFVVPHAEPVLLAILWALMKPAKLCSGDCIQSSMRLILVLETGENRRCAKQSCIKNRVTAVLKVREELSCSTGAKNPRLYDMHSARGSREEAC